MRIHSDLADTIGNTPLLTLKRASEMTGCTILGKCEFLNPGQSVKDRAALYIIRDAVAKGLLKPGGTIVEGTHHAGEGHHPGEGPAVVTVQWDDNPGSTNRSLAVNIAKIGTVRFID